MTSNPQNEASEPETKPQAKRPGRPRGLAWLLGPALAVAVVGVGAVALPEGQSQGAVLSQAAATAASTGMPTGNPAPTGTAAPGGATWKPGAASYSIDNTGCHTTQTASIDAPSDSLANTIAGVLNNLYLWSGFPADSTVQKVAIYNISASGSTVSIQLNGWAASKYCSGGQQQNAPWTPGAIGAVTAAAVYGAVISRTTMALTAPATNAGYPAPTARDLTNPIAGISHGASTGMGAAIAGVSGWQQTLSSAIGGAVIGTGIDGLPVKYLGHYIGDSLYPLTYWDYLTGDIGPDATQAGVNLDATVNQTMYTTVCAAVLPGLQVRADCRSVGYGHSCFQAVTAYSRQHHPGVAIPTCPVSAIPSLFPQRSRGFLIGGNRFGRPPGIALPAGGIPGTLLKGRTA